MPESGFTFRYRLSGERPTIRPLPCDPARVLTRGDLVSWDCRAAYVDLAGETGAQSVVESKHRDLEVVGPGSTEPETLVRICDAKHYAKVLRNE